MTGAHLVGLACRLLILLGLLPKDRRNRYRIVFTPVGTCIAQFRPWWQPLGWRSLGGTLFSSGAEARCVKHAREWQGDQRGRKTKQCKDRPTQLGRLP